MLKAKQGKQLLGENKVILKELIKVKWNLKIVIT
jgi:hypothetical protein